MYQYIHKLNFFICVVKSGCVMYNGGNDGGNDDGNNDGNDSRNDGGNDGGNEGGDDGKMVVDDS